jgi:c-di-GMP-binding flagellar brake protein YcgR
MSMNEEAIKALEAFIDSCEKNKEAIIQECIESANALIKAGKDMQDVYNYQNLMIDKANKLETARRLAYQFIEFNQINIFTIDV